MDFDHLPQEIFERILRYFPLKEKIRMERVSKRFQEIANVVISKTKSINPTKNSLQNMDDEAITKLLNLCSPNLEEIEIVDYHGNQIWIEIFSQFSFLRLTKVDVQTNDENDYFGQVMAKNRNLKNIRWWKSNDPPLMMPENIVWERLEDLKIPMANDSTFRSMTGKCPNLKNFYVGDYSSSISPNDFDNFFAISPKIDTFEIFKVPFRYNQLIHFWRLSSIRSLFLQSSFFVPFDDDDLEKLSTSFPLLEKLHLNDVRATNRGISALAQLKNLRSICLISTHGTNRNIDSGVRRLIGGCEHLRWLEVAGQIMSATLTDLVHRSRNLRYLKINGIIDVSTIEEATTIVQLFGGLIKRNIILINILSYVEIWKSDQVKKVLEELRADGHLIKINNQ